MSNRRKFLVATAALAGVLVSGISCLIGWLAYTESGLARAVDLVESLDAVHIAVEGARGRLAGPLHLDSLEFRTDRLALRVDGIDLDHDMPALAFGRLSVGRLDVESIALAIGPPTAPPEDQLLAFMPRWLAAGFSSARVDKITINLPNATELQYRDVRLSGQVTHSRIELTEASIDAGLWAAAGSIGVVAHKPLRLRGELTWTVPGRPDLSGSLHAKGDLDRLEVAAELREPVVASADITLTDLAAGLHWQASANSAALDLSAWMATPPIGPLVGHVEGSGSLQAFDVTGHFDGPGLPADGLDLAGSLLREGTELILQPLSIASPDRRLTVESSGRVLLTGERSLDLRTTWSGLAWPLAGSPVVSSRRGSLDLRGWDSLEFAVDAAIVAPELPEVSVDASGQADIAGITVLRSALRVDAGSAEATGFFGFSPIRPWRLEARAHELDLATIKPGLDSRLSFHVAGSGQGVGPEAAWAAHIGAIKGTLRGHAASGDGFLRYQRGHYDIEQFAFAVGPARLDLSGHVGGETALLATIDVPDLSGFLPELGGSLEATLKARSVGTAVAEGSNLRVDLSLRGRDLRYGEQRAAVLSADADIDLSDRESSWIRLRGAGMLVGGQEIASTRISLDGLAGAHTVDFQLGAGDQAVSLVGDGNFQGGVYRLTATRIESAAPQLHPYSLEAPMQLTIAADAARLEETCFVYLPRRICLGANWNAEDGWSASLATKDFPLEALRVDLPRRPGYRGRLDVDAHAEGRPDRPWTATAIASLRDAWLEFTTPSGRQERTDLGVTQVRLESRPDRHELTATIDDTNALQLRARAAIDRITGASLADSPLSGSLQFSTTRLGLLPLVVPDIDKIEGKLQADLALSGTLGVPIVGGILRLDDGLLDLYRTNLRLRETAARIDLLDHGLKLESSGKAGDGSFNATGTLTWQGRDLRGQLQFSGERLLLADIPEVRIEASPNLTFDVDGEDIAVTGTVTVPSARIEPQTLVGAVTTSADEHVVTVDEEEQETLPYRISTDLRFVLGKDVKLDAFGLKGRLEGSVVVQSRPDEVAIASGELEIEAGKYRAYTKELDVERGRLLFAGGPVTDPGIDLRARKKVPGYEVGVIARGRLRRPELSLYSDPSMPQSQIASLLLVGRRLDNLDPGDRKSLGGSAGDVATQGGAVLAGQLGRYVGIDEISVETDAAAAATLVIGKFLSPRLYISYGISLSNAINTFKLRYTIGDRWEITGEAGQEASADIEYTIDR